VNPIVIQEEVGGRSGEPKREVSEIQKCVARHRFLWADQIYQSAVAATDEECDALVGMHEDEIREIEDKLVKLTPEDFGSICDLLEFATEVVDEGRTCDKGEVAMLKNVSEGCRLRGQRKW
jgi:hypothetical protein